jgi:hypothetical protein
MAHQHDQPPRPPRGAPGWGPRPGWAPPWAAGPWGPPGPRPGPGPGPEPVRLRIGNAERTEVTNALVRHMAEGRLTEEELEERMAKANAAKTAEDLRPLLADLPPLGGEGPPPPPARRHRSWFVWVIGVLAVLWAFGIAARLTHLAFGPVGFFPPFPLVVLAIVAFVLLRRRRCVRR